MNKKLIQLISKLQLTLKLILPAAFLLIASNAHATKWYVNDNSLTGDVFTSAIGNDANAGTTSAPFATLLFAITSASSGDTLYVDAGTYPSANITITKSLTLRGAKFGIPAGPAAVPVNRGINETIIQAGVYYGASLDNISVDGFTFDIGTNLYGITARGLNSVIINNIVTGIVNPIALQVGIATRANGPLRLHSYLISNNNVRNVRFGIYMDGNLELSSEISYNYVTGCFSTGYLFTASNGHHIKANVSDNNSQGMLFNEGNNLIEQNTITNNALAGIRLAATNQSFGNNIVNNFITNNGVGIALTEDDAAAINNQANYNSLTGNTQNIASVHTASFNATCNWHGTTDVAQIAALVSGTVTYNPFLTNGIDTDLALDGFQPITTCIVLPVILTTFSGVIKNYDILLNWQTSSEINSSHFIVERSIDQINFDGIGRVEAKGFSNLKATYNFTDNKPVNFDRPTYFRLAMVDRDGSIKYSKIISFVLKTKGSYVQQLYPNPAKAGTLLNADFISGSTQKVSVSFINTAGQVINSVSLPAIKGANKFKINIPADVAPGLNFILIRADDMVKQIPVFIH